ncbi:acyl-CoA thioesterase [Sabulicella rubraurantiaca]|uniref:acyl-CoA thioesterase n=1 Tax=Sabulicella rubraurantiaca TaxID=2811429 RepID=UPI001A959E08|nr:thioesterase family protein [Sabulicella rubraurantiaca]
MREVRSNPLRDGEFPVLVPITTRWADNDAFSHINNVAYYSFFDTAVNMWLVENGILDIARSPLVGLVVETGCRYRRPLAYPMTVRIGLRVARLGSSSVRYDVAAFDAAEEAAAEGHFTHVYVDRATGRPAPIPEEWREKFQRISVHL